MVAANFATRPIQNASPMVNLAFSLSLFFSTISLMESKTVKFIEGLEQSSRLGLIPLHKYANLYKSFRLDLFNSDNVRTSCFGNGCAHESTLKRGRMYIVSALLVLDDEAIPSPHFASSFSVCLYSSLKLEQ